MLWDITHEMQLIVFWLQVKLFPNVKEEIECIAALGDIEVITELKSVLLERKDLQLFVMEISIHLLPMTSEAPCMEVFPYW